MKKPMLWILRIAFVMAVLWMLFSIASFLLSPILYPVDYDMFVSEYAEMYDLPPSLVFAVIHTESHFDPDAVSSAGAKGLMQLTDGTYEWVQKHIDGEDQPLDRVYDPEVNIQTGCKALQLVLKQFDVVETALAAYNAGSGNVSKWLENPTYSNDGVTLTTIPFEETRNYVKRVLRAQKKYQALYDIE